MADDRLVWLNGKMIPWREATVPLLSHGFSRSSALFEAFGVHPGPDSVRAFRMTEHLKRLTRTAELVGMELAWSEAEIAAAVAQTVKANRISRGLIKIMAYWSEEAVLHLILDSKLDVAVFAIPDGEGLRFDDATPKTACISKWRKPHPETVPVEAKACANYLNGFLARKSAHDRGYDVGLLLGTDGFVAEGSTESFFLVKDGVLKTPPLGRILAGISRMSLLEMAPSAGVPVQEAALKVEDVFAADEIFFSHSVIRLLPIRRFENRDLEAPGPVTARLIRLVDDVMQGRNRQFDHFFQPLT